MAVTDGYFSWLSSFEGAKGGEPPKKFESFFTLSCQITIALKPEKNNHVLYAKYCTMNISAIGWGAVGDRVKFLFGLSVAII